MPNRDYVINTYAYTLTHTAEQCLTELSGAGFDAFEVMMYPGHVWPPTLDQGGRRALKAFLSERSLTIRSLNQPNIDINLAGATDDMWLYSVSIVRQIVELAADLEAEDVIIGPGKVNPLMPAPQERVIGRFYRALDVLAPLAKSLGVRLLVENMPFAFLPAIDRMMEVVEEYGAEEIGVIYDVANAAFIKENFRHGLERCGSRLKMIHLSDTGSAVYKHDPVGKGTIDFRAASDDALAIGWTDRPVLEIIGVSPNPTGEIINSVKLLDAAGWDRIARNAR
jgi:L-ribulose-5-phosphate 3-epimerase